MKLFEIQFISGARNRVSPDYCIGLRCDGPLGWLNNPKGGLTGVALAVGDESRRTCEINCFTFNTTVDDVISQFYLEGLEVSRSVFETAFLADCGELREETLQT